MTRPGVAIWRIAAATLLASAAAAALAPRADAAYTWAGVWTSTFGTITMSADGSGTYTSFGNPGTLSGGISGTDGRTNSGTWTEGASAYGTYDFQMPVNGLSWDGTYIRTDPAGPCPSPPCDWDGQCQSGACLNNGPAPTPGYEVEFGFEIEPGLPSKVRRKELPRRLISITGHTDDARLFKQGPIGDHDITDAEGRMVLTTRYRDPDDTIDRRRIDRADGPQARIGREGREAGD
jgi:hypothetical protein